MHADTGASRHALSMFHLVLLGLMYRSNSMDAMLTYKRQTDAMLLKGIGSWILKAWPFATWPLTVCTAIEARHATAAVL